MPKPISPAYYFIDFFLFIDHVKDSFSLVLHAEIEVTVLLCCQGKKIQFAIKWMSTDYWPGSSSVRKLSEITYFLSVKSRNLENIFSRFLMRIERESWIISDLVVGCHTFINILIHFSIERENLNSLKYFPSLFFFLSRAIS